MKTISENVSRIAFYLGADLLPAYEVEYVHTDAFYEVCIKWAYKFIRSKVRKDNPSEYDALESFVIANLNNIKCDINKSEIYK